MASRLPGWSTVLPTHTRSLCSLSPLIHLLQSPLRQPSIDETLPPPLTIKQQQCLTFLVTRLCRGGARGLQFLHEKGIVHGDVKLDNFLVSEDRRLCKVTDFGSAGREFSRLSIPAMVTTRLWSGYWNDCVPV